MKNKAWLRSAAATVTAVLLAFMTAMVVSPQQAHAAENKAIQISVKSWEPPNPWHDFQEADLVLAWDASKANPKPGDTFTVELPEEIRFLNDGQVDMKFNGEVVGGCVYGSSSATNPGNPGEQLTSTPQTMSCGFNDKIVGKTGINGEITITLIATKTTEKTQLPLTLNGKSVNLDIPGGVTPWPHQLITKPWKGAGHPGLLSEDLWWNVDFSKEALGKTGKLTKLTFTDTLNNGHVFYKGDEPTQKELGTWLLIKSSDKEHGTVSEVIGSVGAGAGEFKLDVSFENREQASVTITAPAGKSFADDTNYRLQYLTYPTNGQDDKVDAGFKYENTMEIDGFAEQLVKEQFYAEQLKITIDMQDGFGTFGLTKLVTGDTVEKGTKFNVQVDWELPKGKTVKDYPQWTDAPANPLTLEVEVGKEIAAPTFPHGTKITLTEINTPAGYDVTPTFKVDDKQLGDKATFTVESQKQHKVELTNKVTKIVTPAPAPSTPAPSSSAPVPAPSTKIEDKDKGKNADKGKNDKDKPGTLPRTGGDSVLPIALSVLFLGSAAGLAARSRKKN